MASQSRIRKLFGIVISSSVVVGTNSAAWAQETCPDVDITDLNLQPMRGEPGWMPHAQAQRCTNTVGGGNVANGCYHLDGSAALTEVMRQGIVASGVCISYHHVGSSQAADNMLNNKQCIGPMGKNFQPSVLGTYPAWAPSSANVVALDAGLWCFRPKNGGIVDLEDNMLATGYCTAECGAKVPAQLSGMAVVLGGYPSGPGRSRATTAECAHPCRSCLLSYIAAQNAWDRVDHILRPDDMSSTQDLFRDRLKMDRWCNGRSPGLPDRRPGGNLANADLDPIRRDCMNNLGGLNALTRCTYYPTGQDCQFGDAAIPAHGSLTIRGKTVANSYPQPLKCTQGVIVAISERDPDVDKDGKPLTIARSIGARVSIRGENIIGLAEMPEYDAKAVPNNCVNIDGTTWKFSVNIFIGAYKFSRRLFVMRNPNCNVTLNAGMQSSLETSGREAEETTLWNWIQDHECDGMEPISIAAGFLPKWYGGCATACINAVNSTTLTCLAPDPEDGTPKQNIGNETSCGLWDSDCYTCSSSYPCVANGQVGSGSPLTCGGPGGICPVIPILDQGYGCNLNAKCSGGLVCAPDASGFGGSCCPPGTSC